ncbi:MAG: chromate transporter [Spirochaetaceae bacterium]|nr:chromate transporter [Spirochaetaceae bacterium]
MDKYKNAALKPPTPLRLFLLHARINLVTLGGGYVIVPVTASSYEKKGWMTEEEFYEIFAQAQAFPGPLALNTAILSSLKLCGFWGAFAAFWGVIIPPFLAIILVSNLMSTFGSLPAVKNFLDGAGAVVPGLVAAMIWKNAKKRKWNAPHIIETAALAVLLILFPAYSLPILLIGIGCFYAIEVICKRCSK